MNIAAIEHDLERVKFQVMDARHDAHSSDRRNIKDLLVDIDMLTIKIHEVAKNMEKREEVA